MKGVEGQLSWDWNLYTQSYFGLWGRPAREDWKIEYVLKKVCTEAVSKPVRLGLVPDIPRFDPFAFQFYIDVLQLPVGLNKVTLFDSSNIQNNDYVLVAERNLDHPASLIPDRRINDYIQGIPEKFHMEEWFPLPSGDVIRLYKVQ
jgi:hypothetical protein